MILMSGFFDLRYRPTPETVPPVLELASQYRTRRFGDDPLGHLHVVLRVVRRHRRRRDDHLRAERLEQSHFLLRHLVRHGEDAAVALQCGGDGQTHTRVATRCLDDRTARQQRARALMRLDHRKPDAILDAPTRFEEIRLAKDRGANALRYAPKPDERRPPDGLEDIVVRAAVALVRVLRGRCWCRFEGSGHVNEPWDPKRWMDPW